MNPIILYNNHLATATSIVASSTSPGFSPINLMDERPYTYWVAGNSGQQTLTITFNGTKEVDSLGICAHNLKGCTVTLIANGQTIGSIVAPEFAFMIKGNKVNASQVQVIISQNEAESFIGVLFVGKSMEFPEKPNAPYTPFAELVDTDTNISKTNNQLGTDEKNNTVTCNPQFSMLPRTWVNAEYEKFWYASGKVGRWFFYAWDLAICPDEILYMKFAQGSNYQKTYTNINHTDLSLQLEGRR